MGAGIVLVSYAPIFALYIRSIYKGISVLPTELVYRVGVAVWLNDQYIGGIRGKDGKYFARLVRPRR